MRRKPDPANIGRRGARWRQAKQACLQHWGNQCHLCGHPEAYEIDHLIPLADGGNPYDPNNLRPAHGSNYPCPVCRATANPSKPRSCNQERNRTHKRPTRKPYTVDPQDI